MGTTFWEQVLADGLRVPADRPLDELTADLTQMLGDTDPAVRDGIAYPALATWISQGVYDDLLRGLGDGMAAGLDVGLGEDGTDTVFRRSFSVLVLGACVDRDNVRRLLPPDAILAWGDRVAAWLVRERDLRGRVPGKGWAHAVAHGADALAALAASPTMGALELTVLLDVVADRLLAPTAARLHDSEDDRLAHATVAVLRRDVLDVDLLEPWVRRLTDRAVPVRADSSGSAVPGNVQSFLRALHLQLALAPRPPACRSDLLLVLIEALRRTNPHYLA